MRERLTKRYRFEGQLVMQTGLHLGSGKEAGGVTDSPVLRDVDGAPLIPGSSLKGAFRSTVERFAPSLRDVSTCALMYGVYTQCLTTHEPLREELDRLRERLQREGKPVREVEEQFYQFIINNVCDTCKVFGSPFLSARVFFRDLPVLEWAEITEFRDGVGINRDSERAEEHIKFDFEVVPSQTAFQLEMIAENLTDRELGLLAIGLQELRAGMMPVGGLRSRGLGRCRLEDLTIHWVNFQDTDHLRDYLLKRVMHPIAEVDEFLDSNIRLLLE